MEMTFLSWEFFAALGSIIILDLVLAGDNAVVIAMLPIRCRHSCAKRPFLSVRPVPSSSACS